MIAIAMKRICHAGPRVSGRVQGVEGAQWLTDVFWRQEQLLPVDGLVVCVLFCGILVLQGHFLLFLAPHPLHFDVCFAFAEPH